MQYDGQQHKRKQKTDKGFEDVGSAQWSLKVYDVEVTTTITGTIKISFYAEFCLNLRAATVSLIF